MCLSGVQFPAGAMMDFFTTAARPTLEPPKPPIKWASRGLTPSVKQSEHEPDHLVPSRYDA